MSRLGRGRTAAGLAALALGTTLCMAPVSAASASSGDDGYVVDVQTYNLDLGGDLAHLFDPSLDLVTATTLVWQETVASNIPARARGVARQIASRQPDVVGLNEVSVWATAPMDADDASDFTVRYNSLGTLLSTLAALGTPYEVAAIGETFGNASLPLPAMTADGLRLITFTDYNVTLVRSKSLHNGTMRVIGSAAHTYLARLPVTIAAGTPYEQTIYVTRGYVTVDLTTHGTPFRVANTHLEAFGMPPLKDQVRNPQALQLAYELAQSPYPVVLLGDINSRPTMCADYRPGSVEYPLDQNIVAYGYLQSAGLTEVWPALHPSQPCSPASWTSGNRALDGTASALTHRIDDVFFSTGIDPIQVRIDNNDSSDRTPEGLWTSDHATTWAKLLVHAA